MNSTPTLVRGRAPQRLDLVQRGAVADDGSTGRSGRAIRRPIAAGSAKPSIPIALMKPSGARAGMRACSSGRLEGVSSTQDRVAREALGERVQDVAGAQRLAGRRPGGAGRSTRRGGAPRAGVDDLRQRRADRAGIAEHGELDRAAVRLLRVLRDDREPRRRRSTSGPSSYGYWRSAPVPTTSTAS